ncbi:hypothetical protein TNCV_3007901 [Trichonephila clavipes]|nr:hypothetical protein TNCV_3007901 [Trichonephila clavipes]
MIAPWTFAIIIALEEDRMVREDMEHADTGVWHERMSSKMSYSEYSGDDQQYRIAEALLIRLSGFHNTPLVSLYP